MRDCRGVMRIRVAFIQFPQGTLGRPEPYCQPPAPRQGCHLQPWIMLSREGGWRGEGEGGRGGGGASGGGKLHCEEGKDGESGRELAAGQGHFLLYTPHALLLYVRICNI